MGRKPKPVVEEVVTEPWSITQKHIDSLTATRTNQCMPALEDIPLGFIQGNIYTQVIEAWYVGDRGPPATYTFNPDFDHDGPKVKRFLMAHLADFETDYEHKIAGVAYMLAQIFTIKEKP